jgi:hypothetical protein
VAETGAQRSDFKDLPAEFFLPPQSNRALWEETGKLLALCFAFIVVLSIAVVLTQGIVITV